MKINPALIENSAVFSPKSGKRIPNGFLLFFRAMLPVLIVFLLVVPVSLHAQTFTIDTNSFYMEEPPGFLHEPIPFPDANGSNSPEEECEEDEFSGTEPEGEDGPYVPGDMIFVPHEVLYNNRWDTLYIRTGKSDVANMADSVFLLLNNPAENGFVFPFKGKVISRYGYRGSRFHAGIDIKLEQGDTIYNAFDGKVRIARVMSSYGKMVVVRHHNGLETVYSHLSKVIADVNQELKAGDPIGLGGRTGRATTTHLHFETRFRGEHFNPERIIDFENYTLRHDTLLITRSFWRSGNSAATASSGNSQEGSRYHTIRSGDTLSKIARQYGTSVDRLCKLNGISSAKVLRIGSRLRVS